MKDIFAIFKPPKEESRLSLTELHRIDIPHTCVKTLHCLTVYCMSQNTILIQPKRYTGLTMLERLWERYFRYLFPATKLATAEATKIEATSHSVDFRLESSSFLDRSVMESNK